VPPAQNVRNGEATKGKQKGHIGAERKKKFSTKAPKERGFILPGHGRGNRIEKSAIERKR